ncbi:MAG: HD domain-containing protein [Bacteroidales bacterium]|nr:HD domain-containing protein [Bacteroidales bacterium]MDT8431781.1 HD domain-containing protein [Bacteroidales bacterium]
MFKIINDPVYGFIKIRYEIIYRLIEHPLFQRLRRIRQLGMTHFVYPGANHTRFQHALGAMHLMEDAIDSIRSKGHAVTEQEAEAAAIAILLHDIGHGPFSHTLERTLIRGAHHETISLLMMEQLNREFSGKLSLAIRIFKNEYRKKFLHQLVTGQLDVDRLDYLRRDSFFTGVTEGAIGSDRIIKMLQVQNDRLVVEENGIYSIEKFLVARRLMYWQVYLHKGVLAADQLLIMMLERAKDLAASGKQLFATPALAYFLYAAGSTFDEENQEEFLGNFAALDDNDIISAAKVWSNEEDPVLRYLCSGFVNRKLFRIEISREPFSEERIRLERKRVTTHLGIPEELTGYLVISDSISNHAYSNIDDNIKILAKSGEVRDITELSEILNVSVLSGQLKKFYLCYPKKQGIQQ